MSGNVEYVGKGSDGTLASVYVVLWLCVLPLWLFAVFCCSLSYFIIAATLVQSFVQLSVGEDRGDAYAKCNGVKNIMKRVRSTSEKKLKIVLLYASCS